MDETVATQPVGISVEQPKKIERVDLKEMREIVDKLSDKGRVAVNKAITAATLAVSGALVVDAKVAGRVYEFATGLHPQVAEGARIVSGYFTALTEQLAAGHGEAVVNWFTTNVTTKEMAIAAMPVAATALTGLVASNVFNRWSEKRQEERRRHEKDEKHKEVLLRHRAQFQAEKTKGVAPEQRNLIISEFNELRDQTVGLGSEVLGLKVNLGQRLHKRTGDYLTHRKLVLIGEKPNRDDVEHSLSVVSGFIEDQVGQKLSGEEKALAEQAFVYQLLEEYKVPVSEQTSIDPKYRSSRKAIFSQRRYDDEKDSFQSAYQHNLELAENKAKKAPLTTGLVEPVGTTKQRIDTIEKVVQQLAVGNDAKGNKLEFDFDVIKASDSLREVINPYAGK